jgi:uncharacterized protein (DUF1800 family)
MMKNLAAVMALSLAGLSAANATVHDHIFANRFDPISDLPTSANDAARFLTQATFGPTTSDVARVMQVGYSEWIDEQLGMPATLGEPTVESIVNKRTAAAQNNGSSQRLNRWWWQATYAPDQLRQRMAYALSQIFVVSDQNSAIGGDYVPMAHYTDMLAKDAFALFRQTIEDVTYHPSMGKFLNAFRNLKAQYNDSNVQVTSPDENYAREVMQLFSIGLVKLNMNGTPVSSGGVPVPTYAQADITATAKIFTGFTYADAPTTGSPNFYGGGATFAGQYSRMNCWGLELFPYTSGNMKHEITGDDAQPGTPITVIENQQIPGPHHCDDDVSAELDILAAHDSTAPFISKQLIQRFTTSNPSTTYVSDVAAVFVSSNGDLGDVLKKILTHPEARPLLVSTGASESDRGGKLREPILRITAVWRAFNAVAQVKDTYGEIPMLGGGISIGNLGQNMLQAPTVFNFYTPDYAQPGVFADNDLVSPELQIANESSVYLLNNTFYNLTHGAYVGMTGPPTDRPLINLNALIFANGSSGAAPTEANMIAYVNNAMMYGSMSSDMQTKLTSMLHSGMNGASAQERAWSLVYVTMLSPEFTAQR